MEVMRPTYPCPPREDQWARHERIIGRYIVRFDYPRAADAVTLTIRASPENREERYADSYLDKWENAAYTEARDVRCQTYQGYEYLRFPCRRDGKYRSGCRLYGDGDCIELSAASADALPPLFRNISIRKTYTIRRKEVNHDRSHKTTVCQDTDQARHDL